MANGIWSQAVLFHIACLRVRGLWLSKEWGNYSGTGYTKGFMAWKSASFSFVLGFNFFIRENMLAPCYQHFPVCFSRAWMWWTVGLGGPHAPQHNSNQIEHLSGANLQGQCCHPLRCGAWPELIDNKTFPDCHEDRKNLWASTHKPHKAFQLWTGNMACVTGASIEHGG